MKKTIAAAAATAAVLTFGVGTASGAHQSVDNPSGCHDTASRAGANNPDSNWNRNEKNRASDRSPVVSSGTC